MLLVMGQRISVTREEAESQEPPRPKRFSARETVSRRSFSALGVTEQACIREMPNGFGDVGVLQ